MSDLETRLTHQILLAQVPDARLFRNASAKAWVGKLLTVTKRAGTVHLPEGATVLRPGARRIQAGLCDGSSDIIGIGPGGLFTAIEVKAGSTRDQEHQARFIHMVRDLGGRAGFARSVEQALDILEGRA